MSRAIVIGAGIGGIASGLRLRHLGYEVDIFESNTYGGGKLAEIKLGPYRFDAGPSLFTMPSLVTELFELFGESPTDWFNYIRKDVGCHYFFEDGTFIEAKANPETFAQEVSGKLDVSKDEVLDYLKRSQKKYELTAPLFLEKSLHKPRTFFSGKVLKALARMPLYEINKTMHEANSKAFQDPRAVQLFNRYATYNGSTPYKAPGILTMIPHLELGIGTYFPKGGMRQIPESLMKLAQHQGIRFHFGKPVDRIIVKDHRATGIETGGQAFDSDIVVSNMDVVPTYRKLLPDQPAPEKTLSQERSSSALIFYWGINRSFPNLDLHNIFFSRDYETEFHQIFEEKTIGEDPTIYVHISSKEEPSDAPEGGENWFVMINVPGNTGQDWDQLITKAKSAIIKKLDRLLKSDIRALIEEEDILDPRLIESRTTSYQGSLYGASSNDKNAAFLRHANFSKKIKGLFFCGGSVHPGGGIPLCLQSAKIVSSLVPHVSNAS